MPSPSTPDAIHIATASIYRVDAVHTFDDGKKGPRPDRFSLLAHSGNFAGENITVCKPFAEGFDPHAPVIAPTPDLFDLTREGDGE